jgi:hypothetical protein
VDHLSHRYVLETIYQSLSTNYHRQDNEDDVDEFMK